MGGMDGQKALGIELLSIQSMDAGAGRRWRPDEVGGLGLHGAAKDEVAGVGLGTKQGRRSSCSGRCGEGNRVDEDETQIWAAGAHLRRWWRRWSSLREGEDQPRRCRSGARGRERRRSGASAPSLFLAAREGTRG